MTGSLAPPPPYGSEQGSILLEAGREGAHSSYGSYPIASHNRTRSGNVRPQPMSPGPIRSSTDISLAHLVHIPTMEDQGEASNSSSLAIPSSIQVTGPEHNMHGMQDQTQPPPEYTSPTHSDDSLQVADDDRRPILRRKTTPPPIPSYSDAIAESRARGRSHSEQPRSILDRRIHQHQSGVREEYDSSD